MTPRYCCTTMKEKCVSMLTIYVNEGNYPINSVFNPVKICGSHLPSKTRNDIIRRANPRWSNESLSKIGYLRNESQYFQAVELESKCQYLTEDWSDRRNKIRYKTKCVFGLNSADIELASAIGSTSVESLNKAKEKAIYFIERRLLLEEIVND